MNKKNIEVTKVKEEIINLKKTILNLNFQKSTGQLEKTSQIKTAKKQIARFIQNDKLKILHGIMGRNSNHCSDRSIIANYVSEIINTSCR